MQLVKWLQGKKTFLVAIGIAVVVGLQAAGILDTEIANTILGFLGASGLITLRAGLKK